jgi:hypothetical protein
MSVRGTVIIGRTEKTPVSEEYVFVQAGDLNSVRFYGPDADEFAEMFVGALERKRHADDLRAAAGG